MPHSNIRKYILLAYFLKFYEILKQTFRIQKCQVIL